MEDKMVLNDSDLLYLPVEYENYISIAVHNHILNSLGTVWIIAFVTGFCFGFLCLQFTDLVKWRLKGLK